MDDDGQHRSDGTGAQNNGQRSSHLPGTVVGQTRGGEQAMSVPKPAADADISTTTHSGGGGNEYGDRKGADDK